MEDYPLDFINEDDSPQTIKNRFREQKMNDVNMKYFREDVKSGYTIERLYFDGKFYWTHQGDNLNDLTICSLINLNLKINDIVRPLNCELMLIKNEIKGDVIRFLVVCFVMLFSTLNEDIRTFIDTYRNLLGLLGFFSFIYASFETVIAVLIMQINSIDYRDDTDIINRLHSIDHLSFCKGVFKTYKEEIFDEINELKQRIDQINFMLCLIKIIGPTRRLTFSEPLRDDGVNLIIENEYLRMI